MWEDIIFLAVGNGLWAVLSCILLSYLLKDSKKREAKFTQIVEELADRLKIVAKIQEDVKSLSERVDVFTVASVASGSQEKRIATIQRIGKTRERQRTVN